MAFLGSCLESTFCGRECYIFCAGLFFCILWRFHLKGARPVIPSVYSITLSCRLSCPALSCLMLCCVVLCCPVLSCLVYYQWILHVLGNDFSLNVDNRPLSLQTTRRASMEPTCSPKRPSKWFTGTRETSRCFCTSPSRRSTWATWTTLYKLPRNTWTSFIISLTKGVAPTQVRDNSAVLVICVGITFVRFVICTFARPKQQYVFGHAE